MVLFVLRGARMAEERSVAATKGGWLVEKWACDFPSGGSRNF